MKLHPKTAALVDRFAAALKEKLAAAEEKYGYSDGWATDDWMGECRKELRKHVAKGDPLDVAAYCAFLWHHGEATTGKEEVCDPPMGIDTPQRPAAPAWQDVLGAAEQLVRQKPAFPKYIKGTVLENDVPVWIATFTQQMLVRELSRIRAVQRRFPHGGTQSPEASFNTEIRIAE